MNRKRTRPRENPVPEHSVNKYERLGKALLIIFCLLWLILLITMPRARAAELDCLVKPEMYVELSSPVDSVMEQILVDTGDTVIKDQPLVLLEASVEKAKVKLAQLQAKSSSDIDNRREQLRYAKQYHKRMSDLLTKNSVSQYEKDKAETEVALARIELNKAKEKKRIAQLNLELARTQLALRTIKSPIDGIVVDRYAMVGESVSDRTIMKLAKVDPLKVELIAPTEYFGLIEKGMQVEIYPEQPSNQVFIATVSIVDQLIDPASGSFTVRMRLPNPDDKLVGGVNCLANFSFETPRPSNEDVFSALGASSASN
ncbi:MAG: efflux RND transporter periplasmic adaptor subunit [Gammaproteobacteria bacterium]|nr:efflux RND transporter periplasmic adaptor subunit [Gammaproteobacteria bacterium]